MDGWLLGCGLTFAALFALHRWGAGSRLSNDGIGTLLLSATAAAVSCVLGGTSLDEWPRFVTLVGASYLVVSGGRPSRLLPAAMLRLPEGSADAAAHDRVANVLGPIFGVTAAVIFFVFII